METVKSAAFWSLVDKFGAQAVSFVISTILARILSPDDYGLIGLTFVFISFSGVFIDCGFGNALIRKTDRSEDDLNTTFTLNIIIGLVIYALLFLFAPLVAWYFDSPILTVLLRIVGLNVVFNSLCIVPFALLMADLKVRHISLVNLGAQIPTGILAIVLAMSGFGVYSLAVQSLASAVLVFFYLCFCTTWRPKFCINKVSLAYLWQFGSKLLSANIIGVLFNEMYTLIIGKFIGKTELGLYSKGRSLAMNFNTLFVGVIQRIALPVFSKVQDDIQLLSEQFAKYNAILSLLSSFIYCALFVVAYPLILLLWGDQWTGAVLLFQLVLCVNLFSPTCTLSLVLLQAVNRTDISLKQEFIKKPIALLLVLMTIKWGVVGLLCGQIVSAAAEYVVCLSAPYKLINYNFKCICSDSIRFFLIAFFSAFASMLTLHLACLDNLFLQLLVGGATSVVVFSLILFVSKDKTALLLLRSVFHHNV